MTARYLKANDSLTDGHGRKYEYADYHQGKHSKADHLKAAQDTNHAHYQL